MPEWNVPGYTELKALGSCGFGEVLLARHDASGVLVAIKYLRHELLADPGFVGMFRGEAAVLASLENPNIVRLYEYVESPSGAAIVMELINGVSVHEILAHQGSTAPEAALVVLQGSLLGLAAAHQRGIVHRDYKPADHRSEPISARRSAFLVVKTSGIPPLNLKELTDSNLAKCESRVRSMGNASNAPLRSRLRLGLPSRPLSRNSLRFRDISGDLIRGGHEAEST